MVTITRRGVTLSAHAVANGFPAPVYPAPRAGDFAETVNGRDRRASRLAVARGRYGKRAYLESCQ